MVDLFCPVCGSILIREPAAYRCANRHCFDLARSGYVNLLPPSPAGKRHGDDKRMVAARTAFLSRGCYDHLVAAVCACCAALPEDAPWILDAGCGEGTYTKAISDTLRAQGKHPQIIGVDISVEAVKRAAKLLPEAVFCAASTAALPLADSCLDLVVNIFSPFMADEFRRVLRPGGMLLRVVPMERHLFELKAAVYDHPYENPPTPLDAAGFCLCRTQQLRKQILLCTQEDVQNLFLMTPYYYKTGAADQKKLEAVHTLSVTTEFALAVYRKL